MEPESEKRNLNQETGNDSEKSVHPAGGMHLFRVAGIPIRVHVTFLLLVGWFALSAPEGEVVKRVLFLLAIFACVVLHELGHSIVAKRYGIRVSEIVLYPMGGVAKLENSPKPHEELWIALAGPAVNVVIAFVIWLATRGTARVGGDLTTYLSDDLQLTTLMRINIMLAIFNLIPAFPMDGGRVLRALLAMKTDEYRATRVATAVGQFLAFGLGLYGLKEHNPIMIFIAFVVYIGAGQESLMVQGKRLIVGLTVRDAMINDFHRLPVSSTLEEAREALLRTSQTDFPVTLGEIVHGVLSRTALLHGLAAHGPTGYVTVSMDRNFATSSPDAPLSDIADEMQSGGSGCVLVMDDSRLIGMVTKENLAELLLVRQIVLKNES